MNLIETKFRYSSVVSKLNRSERLFSCMMRNGNNLLKTNRQKSGWKTLITFRFGGFPNGGKVKPSKKSTCNFSSLQFTDLSPKISVRQFSLFVLNVVLNFSKYILHSSHQLFNLLFTLKINHLSFNCRIVNSRIDGKIKSITSIGLNGMMRNIVSLSSSSFLTR